MEQKKYPAKKEVVKKDIKKIATGRTKKKNVVEKAASNLIAEDVGSIKQYVVMDVLIPAAKKAISDIVVNGIDMILYGEAGHTKRKSGSSVSYRRYYDEKRGDEGRRYGSTSRASRSTYAYDEVVLDSIREANDVIDQLYEILDTYSVVSVADLYELVGITGPFTANKYGWVDLGNAEPLRVRDGYLIKLPKPRPIEN